MQYSPEQMEKIKELASQLMRPEHIALLIGVDQEEFKRNIKHQSSPAYIAYETGKAETILELRKQELKLAKLGSPLAVEMVHRFMVDQEQNE
jgi:hypothetical protein